MTGRPRAVWLVLAAAGALACNRPARDARRPAREIPQVAASTPAPAASTARRLRPAAWDRYPSEANAGAETCHVGAPVALGQLAGGLTRVAFGDAGGLAAWSSQERTLALRSVGRDAAPSGDAETVAIDADVGLRDVYALGDRFVVLLVAWQCSAAKTRWWALAIDGDGHSGAPAPIALDLDDRDVTAARVIAADRLELVAPRAACAAKTSGPEGRWLELELEPDGALHQTARDSPLTDPAQPVPDDAIEASVGPLLDAPPGGGRSAGGRIIEPIHTAALRRTVRRRDPDGGVQSLPLGSPLALEDVPGSPVSWFLPSDVSWSGTHFVYAYGNRREPAQAMLLPISCRP